MSLYKRGNIWWYNFRKNGKPYQGSTEVSNKNKDREILEKLKTDLAQARFGLAPQRSSPLLKDFLAPDGKFLQHKDKNSKVASTANHYRRKCVQLCRWNDWRELPLSEITQVLVNDYSSYRAANIGEFALRDELAVLRHALRLAEKWKLAPKVDIQLPPEPQGRMFIVSAALEKEYLAAAEYPLRQPAVLISDLGLRPEECTNLQKTDISEDTLQVRKGKTKNARRALPLTDRAKAMIEALSALFPDSPWLFPSRIGGGPYKPKSLSEAHDRLRAKMGWTDDFVLYSFRHTFGTMLAESGANPFEIMQLMGHSDLETTMKYVHPTVGGLTLAMKRREQLAKANRGEQAEDSLHFSVQRSVNS